MFSIDCIDLYRLIPVQIFIYIYIIYITNIYNIYITNIYNIYIYIYSKKAIHREYTQVKMNFGKNNCNKY